MILDALGIDKIDERTNIQDNAFAAEQEAVFAADLAGAIAAADLRRSLSTS